MGSEQSTFKRLAEFSPAYSKRDPDPAKDYGIAAVRIRFVLIGQEGAVQLLLGTTWYLPSDQREGRRWQYDHDTRFDKIHPEAWDLGYHADSLHPIEKRQTDNVLLDADGEPEWTTPSQECPYTPSGRCFYDGSSLDAEPLVDVLLSEGSDGIWRELEKYYSDIFRSTRTTSNVEEAV